MLGTIAHHLVISAYGFWLPNDPRGSWSQYVGSPDLFQFGPATKTDERRSKAHEEHDAAVRREAKKALKYSPVRFTPAQVAVVANGFEQYVRKSGLVVRACSIMPDHVHFVLDPFRVSMEQVSNLLKGASTTALTRVGAHPFESHRSGASCRNVGPKGSGIDGSPTGMTCSGASSMWKTTPRRLGSRDNGGRS